MGEFMQKFYEGLAEILEIDPSEVTPTLVLADQSWDSLAIVSTIALVDECFEVMLPSQALIACVTAGDIEKLIRDKKG
jgi:acyl carrier protein